MEPNDFHAIANGKITDPDEFGLLLDSKLTSLQLRPDNDTRWNSVYLMVERAMQLRDVINLFCQRSVRDKDRKK